MTDESLNLEQKMITQAVQIGLANQFDQAEKLDVDVKTDLLHAMQGQANSVSLQGQGVVVKKGVRLQEIEVQTDRVDINLLSAIAGQVKLNQPLDSKIRLLLTEEDLNQTLNAEVVTELLADFTLYFGNSPTSVRLRTPLKMYFPEPGKLEIQGWMLCCQAEETKLIGFTAILGILVDAQQRLLSLEEFRCQPGQGISIQLASGFIQRLESFLQNPLIKLETMIVRILEFKITTKGLFLQLESQISQLPNPQD